MAEEKSQEQHNLDAVNLLIKTLKPFMANSAHNKEINLEMYGDWAEVSTRTYESIHKSGKLLAGGVEDEMTFTAIIMKANHRDSHGAHATAEVVKAACQSYNEMGNGACGVQHALAVSADTIQMIESFIAPQDFEIVGEKGTTLVKAGDWVGTAQFNNEFFWNMAKSGDLDSFSIEADGLIVEDDVDV